MPDIIPNRQRRGARNWLLAKRAADVVIGAAVVGLSRPPGDQDFGGAGLGGIAVEAFALLETFGLAELIGSQPAIRRAVGGNGTNHAPAHHGRRLRQTRQTV